MTIETRFEKGAVVWFMQDNKVYSGIIDGFNISFDTNLIGSPVMIRYYVKTEIDRLQPDAIVWDNQCYETRQELIDYL